MPDLPRISIITPSYNQGQFLEETIRSVLDQGYPNLEYMIFDGGSQDQSVEIIQKYADRLAYWVSERDRGQSHAINKGFLRCTGEIIAWLNSDDLYVPGALAFVADTFASYPEVDLLYGDAEIIDASGKFIMHRKELPIDPSMGNLIGWGLLIPQPAAFFRRRVLDRAGLLDETLRYCLDAEFWGRVSAHGTIQHFPRLLARQRYHSQAKTIKEMTVLKQYDDEVERVHRQDYSRLPISRWLPYRFAPLLRRVYRLKRIFLRLVRGHYFCGYIPDSILRRRQF